jgi:Chaperone of endosialidase
MVRWIKFITFFLLLSCVPKKGTITAPSSGSSSSGGQAPQAIIHSVVVTNDQLIINGSDLQDVTSVTLSSNTRSAGSKPFKVVTASITQLITEAIDTIEIPTNTALNLILSNAYGQTSFPIDFTVQNGEVVTSSIQDYAITTNKIANANVTLSKLAPNTGTNPTNGDVVTWNGSSFVLAPGGGGGPGGGITSISSGAGIIANPNPITTLGTISVNTGITGSATSTVIPFFNSQSQIVLTGGVNTPPAKVIFGNTDPVNYSIYNDGDFVIREEGATPKEIFVIEPSRVSINEDLYVNSKPVCVNSGSGCGGSGLTTVTTTAPLVASGTTSVNISAGALNTANNLVQLNGSAQLPVLDGSLLTNIPNMASTATGDNYLILSGATSKSLVPANYQMPISACTDGQILKADSSGNFQCANDAGGVISFNTRTGAVVSAVGDYSASQIINIATAPISSSNVQGALDELGSEKLALAGGTMNGQISTNSPIASKAQNAFEVGPYGPLTGQTGEIHFTELLSLNYVGFKAPDVVANTVIWTLPSTPGTNGQVLTTGAGNILSWTTIVPGTGDVIGPATSTQNAIPIFSDVNGKNLQNSSFAINGNSLSGGFAVIGENLGVVPAGGTGCFSNSAYLNSATEYAICQGGLGNTMLNSSSTVLPLYINYGGVTQISVNATYTTISRNLAVEGVATFNSASPATNSYSFPTNRGTAGQVLTTDGAGLVTWENIPLSTVLEYPYEFDTDTAAGANPGQIRIDNASPTLATFIYISEQDNSNPTVNRSARFELLKVGDLIDITSTANGNNDYLYNVTGVATKTGSYFQIPVTAKTISGTISDKQKVVVGLVFNANKSVALSLEASDTKIKKDIRPIESSIDKILALKPIRYKWKYENNLSDQVGLSAKEVAELFPEVTGLIEPPLKSKIEGEILGINYAKLVVPLIKAFQEQEEEINALQEKIQSDKETIQELVERVKRLEKNIIVNRESIKNLKSK